MDHKHHFHTQQLQQDDANDRLVALYNQLIHEKSHLESLSYVFRSKSIDKEPSALQFQQALNQLQYDIEKAKNKDIVNPDLHEQNLEVIKDIVSVPSILVQLIQQNLIP